MDGSSLWDVASCDVTAGGVFCGLAFSALSVESSAREKTDVIRGKFSSSSSISTSGRSGSGGTSDDVFASC